MAWDDDADLCLQRLLILYHTQNAIRCEKLCANLLRGAPMPPSVQLLAYIEIGLVTTRPGMNEVVTGSCGAVYALPTSSGQPLCYTRIEHDY